MAKVESFQGTTSREFFFNGLENADDIAGLAAAVLWKDGRVTAGWSNADAAHLARLIDPEAVALLQFTRHRRPFWKFW